MGPGRECLQFSLWCRTQTLVSTTVQAKRQNPKQSLFRSWLLFQRGNKMRTSDEHLLFEKVWSERQGPRFVCFQGKWTHTVQCLCCLIFPRSLLHRQEPLMTQEVGLQPHTVVTRCSLLVREKGVWHMCDCVFELWRELPVSLGIHFSPSLASTDTWRINKVFPSGCFYVKRCRVSVAIFFFVLLCKNGRNLRSENSEMRKWSWKTCCHEAKVLHLNLHCTSHTRKANGSQSAYFCQRHGAKGTQ